MGKYKIKISYCTGNSFGSEDTEDLVELDWDNLDIAKENLQYIKEHYKQYEECNTSKQTKNRRYIHASSI